jgi:hypothetical protein
MATPEEREIVYELIKATRQVVSQARATNPPGYHRIESDYFTRMEYALTKYKSWLRNCAPHHDGTKWLSVFDLFENAEMHRHDGGSR